MLNQPELRWNALCFKVFYSRTHLFNNLCIHSLLLGIAGKLGSIVELVSGQTKITESNIEDTLKVELYYFLIQSLTYELT